MKTNFKLLNFVKKWADIMTPDHIHWCDGTDAEYHTLMEKCVALGKCVKLNEKLRPNCYAFNSDPSDVARVENRTFMCHSKKENSGPTNNWMDIEDMKWTLMKSYTGCMRGRTLYVIPFSMGPVGSKFSKIGIELTDSEYVVCNMKIMTRMGQAVLDCLDRTNEDFVPCIHSVGFPLKPGQEDPKWPCAPIENKFIVQFPDTNEVWSYGSGYGGNALLGKKCFALRIATNMAKREGWFAEHMLIMGITDEETKVKKYITAAFPSACGKTNLAMLKSNVPGLKIETLGDDIAWMRFGEDGQIYALNPENGFFGVAPGTSYSSNPNAMDSLKANCIFTNCGVTPDGDVWWEQIGHDCPEGTTTWKYQKYDPTSKEPCAHPNARFTAPCCQCPVVDKDWEKPEGAPISAILFGGRRPQTIPLVNEALNWNHGVFMGSSVGSEVTAAAIGLKAGVRRDPFAMLPFCGYNMGDFFGHWIKMGQTPNAKLPKIFTVNWFRKNAEGKFIWPGFGDNARILKWVLDRVNGKAKGIETAIGVLPDPAEINIKDLKGIDDKILADILSVDKEGWLEECKLIEEHQAMFGEHLPKEMKEFLEQLKAKLAK